MQQRTTFLSTATTFALLLSVGISPAAESQETSNTRTFQEITIAPRDEPAVSPADGALPPGKTVIRQGKAGMRVGGGVYEGPRDELTEQQRDAIKARIDASKKQLQKEGKLRQAPPAAAVEQQSSAGSSPQGPVATAFRGPGFVFPLGTSARFGKEGYYGISNFVDEDSRVSDYLLDYNCGNKTYDTTSGYNHQGTDFFTWPFPFSKMDADEVTVLAAAPGTITLKDDGYDDRSCRFSSAQWNAVYITHADGSVAWYGHLKKGSLTTKAVGETVRAGEKLGIVGSSGNSTGPHLHFEVYDAQDRLVDPWQGRCNATNSAPGTSWWKEQIEYLRPAINKITTGKQAPVHDSCGDETPNITDNFTPGNTIYLTSYYVDQLATSQGLHTIYKPNGVIWQQWTHDTDRRYYVSSWWWWSMDLETQAPKGTWTYEIRFDGLLYKTYFNVGDPTTITMTRPQGGETLSRAVAYNILWTDNLGGPVRIDLYKAGLYYKTLARSIASTGKFRWKPSSPNAADYRLRITNLANPSLFAETAADFTIGP